MQRFTVFTTLRAWHGSRFAVLLCLLAPAVFGQTNLMPAGSAPTNSMAAVRLPALSDFQRLQYYYAAAPNSPAPGTERHIFTLRADRRWNEDWNSKLVPRPTRAQLNAITPQQFDLFRRAAQYTDGAWQIATASTNIPLAALTTVSDALYTQIRLTAERDRLQQQIQQINLQLQRVTTESAAPAPVPSQ